MKQKESLTRSMGMSSSCSVRCVLSNVIQVHLSHNNHIKILPNQLIVLLKCLAQFGEIGVDVT